MQAQTPEVSGAEATTNTFVVGDRVSYVVTKTTGRGVRFTAREGKIIAIDGGTATVQARNGTRTTLPFDLLTPEGQPNALTRALMGSN
jgi:hypothetical protein